MIPYQHKVQYYETDKMNFTHHSNYIRFMEEARLDFMEQIGWNYDKMEQEGIISPIVDISCNYKKSTTYPEVIDIRVKVKRITPAKLTLSYRMDVGDRLVCEGSSTSCFLDETGKPVSVKKRFSDLYAKLESLQEERVC